MDEILNDNEAKHGDQNGHATILAMLMRIGGKAPSGAPFPVAG